MADSNYIIIINGTTADLDGDIKMPALFKPSSLLTDPQEDSGSEYSFTFTIPYSDRNVATLGYVSLQDYNERFYSSFDLPMTITTSGGTGLASGIVVVRTTRQYGDFECVFVGRDSSWIQDIQDVSLRDTRLGEINFVGAKTWGVPEDGPDPVSIQDTINFTDATDGPVVQFPVISYGNFYDPTVGEPVAELNYKLAFEDLPPSIYVRPIVLEIFRAIGLSVVGGWINSLQAKRLLMPYTGEQPPAYNWAKMAACKAIHSADTFYNDLSASDNADFSFSSPLGTKLWLVRNDQREYDYGYNWDTQTPTALNDWDGNDYSCPQDGFYQFSAVLDVSNIRREYTVAFPDSMQRVPLAIVKWDGTGGDILPTLGNYIASGATIGNPNVLAWIDLWVHPSASAPFNAVRGVGDVLINTVAVTGTAGAPNYFEGNGLVELLSPQVELKKGDKVKIVMAALASDATVAFNNHFGLALVGTTSYSNVTYPDGEPLLSVAAILPDMTQQEFMVDLMKLYGLHVLQDSNSGQVLIESDEDWMLGKETALDLSDRGRWQDGTTEEPNFKAEYLFRWANDSSDGLFKSQPNQEYGGYKYSLNLGRRGVGRQILTVDNFAATAERQYVNQGQIDRILDLGSGYGIVSVDPWVIPTIASQAQLMLPLNQVNWDFKYMPRLIYWLGLQEKLIRYADYDDPAPVVEDAPMEWYLEDITIEKLPASTFAGTSDPQLDLRWSNLFEVYYRRAYEELKGSFIHKNQILLEPGEYYNFNPRRPVLFAGKYFRLLLIEGYQVNTKEKTNVSLSFLL